MVTLPCTVLRNLDELYESLSNVEFGNILDGGSVRIVARRPGGLEWEDAYVDVDGLWIIDVNNPGYVQNVKGWRISRHY
jgi:hypothetical protein